jgi:hypothetical protein
MSVEKSKRRLRSKSRARAAWTMPKWQVWLIVTALLGLAVGLLWMGLAIVVRCERVHDGRVDVTVERRFLGLITLSRETIPDVTKAEQVLVRARTSGGGKQSRGSTAHLALTPRQGPLCKRARIGPSIGTQPHDMAHEIQRFIDDRYETSLTTWWMPWLVNLAALPFALLVGALLGESLLRVLGFIKPQSPLKKQS